MNIHNRVNDSLKELIEVLNEYGMDYVKHHPYFQGISAIKNAGSPNEQLALIKLSSPLDVENVQIIAPKELADELNSVIKENSKRIKEGKVIGILVDMEPEIYCHESINKLGNNFYSKRIVTHNNLDDDEAGVYKYKKSHEETSFEPIPKQEALNRLIDPFTLDQFKINNSGKPIDEFLSSIFTPEMVQARRKELDLLAKEYELSQNTTRTQKPNQPEQSRASIFDRIMKKFVKDNNLTIAFPSRQREEKSKGLSL